MSYIWSKTAQCCRVCNTIKAHVTFFLVESHVAAWKPIKLTTATLRVLEYNIKKECENSGVIWGQSAPQEWILNSA